MDEPDDYRWLRFFFDNVKLGPGGGDEVRRVQRKYRHEVGPLPPGWDCCDECGERPAKCRCGIEVWTQPFSDEQLRRLAASPTPGAKEFPVVAVCPLVHAGQWLVMPLPTSLEGWAGECEECEEWEVKFGTMTTAELGALGDFDGW